MWIGDVMLVLVSPAKKMDFGQLNKTLTHSSPDFFTDTKKLVKSAKKLSRLEIKKLMNLSDSLSDLNFQRFKNFELNQNQSNSKQAALTFSGDTYVGLDSSTLSESDLLYAQDHLRIISGLYGLLRPLDLIQPYRLEMGRKFSNERGENLYDFWGDSLAKNINSIASKHDNATVINLASNEYFKAVKQNLIKSSVITPVFKEIKNNKSSVIGFLAKKARGTMARYIIQNRIEKPEKLKLFTEERYQFQKDQSDSSTWVFSRQFIPVGK